VGYNFIFIKSKRILTIDGRGLILYPDALNYTRKDKNMNELTINVSRDFGRVIGGREKKICDFSGEEFRERFLDDNFDTHDKITIELDGVLGYPWDFLDEVFGVIAKRYGKEAFWEKIHLVSANNYATEKIEYIVNHAKKKGT